MSFTKLTDALFTETIKKQICQDFSIDRTTLRQKDGFCSYVFQAQVAQQWVALKVSHSSRIDCQTINSELDFVQYLHSNNLSIAAVAEFPGVDRLLVYPDGAGGQFFAYCFQWIDGTSFEDLEKDEQSLQTLGKTLAGIHRSSQEFVAKTPRIVRPSLNNNESYRAAKYLPENEKDIVHAFHKLMKNINEIPKSQQSFGLTHSDCHDGNILRTDNGDLFFIDFDDCEFHYFINDIAIMLYTFFPPDGTDPKGYTEFVFIQLMKGYFKIRPIPIQHFQFLPLFLKFRSFMIHILSAQIESLTGVQRNPALVERRRARFRNNFKDLDSLIRLDFEALGQP